MIWMREVRQARALRWGPEKGALPSCDPRPGLLACGSPTGRFALREKVRLVSTAGTGYHYYTMKNRRNSPEKLRLRKYDARARKHVEFVEQKMPSHSKK